MGSRYVDSLGNDGTTLLGHQSTTKACVYTNADASTSTVLRDFTPLGVSGVRQLGDGELLVAVDNDGAGNPGTLWKSTNYPTLGAGCTWTQVLAAQHDGASFNHIWGVFSDGAIVVACEYGGKVPPKASTRAYVSQDYGATWAMIYDAGQINNLHMHGAAYDRWWDRIWLVQGDSPNQKVMYSDDWRNATPTWTTAYTTKLLLAIMPLENAICFTSDDAPAGIFRLKRTGYRTYDPMEVAHQVSATALHVGMQIFRRGTNYPALFSFKITDGQSDNGVLVASYDGLDFYELWHDNLTPYPGGLHRMVGPTNAGKLVGTNNDNRNAPYTRLMADAPRWDKK